MSPWQLVLPTLCEVHNSVAHALAADNLPTMQIAAQQLLYKTMCHPAWRLEQAMSQGTVHGNVSILQRDQVSWRHSALRTTAAALPCWIGPCHMAAALQTSYC
jgi:hypothetical protein